MISNRYAWILILGTLGLLSCNEKTSLDQSALPIVDGINVFQEDTFSIISTNVLVDSLVTSDVESIALGMCESYPYFGPVTMDAAIQFKLPVESFVFTGDNPTIDSIVMVLPYAGAYLDSTSENANQEFSLHILDESLDITKDYYNFDDVAYGSTIVNQNPSKIYNFNEYEDSVEVWGSQRYPQIRMRLSDDFTQKMRDADASIYESSDNFIEWLPGFYIKSIAQNANGFGYFSLGNAGLEVHYHNDTDDSLMAKFPYFSGTCTHYTKVKRTYDNDILNSIQNPNPDGEEWTYLCISTGVKTKLVIPYLESLEDNIINDAIIEVIAKKNDHKFPIMSYVNPLVYTDSIPSTTKDYNFGLELNISNYNLGQVEEITLPSGEEAYKYQLRITRELSDALIEKRPLELLVGGLEFARVIPYIFIAEEATKIGGTNRSDDFKLKLKILYSKK